MQLRPQDIETIELATCEAVSPAQVERVGAWLVSLDNGSVGRAKTAVPLSHEPMDAAALTAAVEQVERCYQSAGLPPAFRLADVSALQGIAHRLQELGYAGHQPTIVMVAQTKALVELAVPRFVPQFSAEPSPDWAAVYTSDGFDAKDGAHRVRVLSRARSALYARVDEGGATLAAGVLALGQGWASVHGMRTLPTARRRGLCSALLHAMALQAQARGVERFFLQVEEGNPAARLYRRVGFTDVWCYRYWR